MNLAVAVNPMHMQVATLISLSLSVDFMPSLSRAERDVNMTCFRSLCGSTFLEVAIRWLTKVNADCFFSQRLGKITE